MLKMLGMVIKVFDADRAELKKCMWQSVTYSKVDKNQDFLEKILNF